MSEHKAAAERLRRGLSTDLEADVALLEAALVEAQREARSEWDTQAATIRLIDEKWHAAEARAEQAERQVREIREGIAEVEARCVKAEDELREVQAERERHNCTNDARRLAGKREGVALVRDYLRALSGVSGPTTGEPDWMSDPTVVWAVDEPPGPATEGASDD